MILRTREMLTRQRSQTANALRAHMAELGIIAGTGMASIAKLLVLLRDEKDNRIPGAARFALIQFAEQIELLTTRIEKLDREILVAVRKDPDARRLMTILGVGPLIAATVRTSLVQPEKDLAARAVPHMSQSQFWTPIPRLTGGQYCRPNDTDRTEQALRQGFPDPQRP
jgi:transposase